MGEKKPTEQRQRFVEMARELGCGEEPEAFEKAFAKVVPPKPRPSGCLSTRKAKLKE